MDFRELKYILAAAETKSVSMAAQKLLISQPTISLAINDVERRLGVKLFDRGAQGINPTPAGERFLRTARLIMAVKDQMDSEMTQLSMEGSKRLILGISSLWAECLLPHVLPECKTRFPEARIHVREETSSVLARWLTKGEVDLAVVTQPRLPATIHFHKLFEERLLVAVSPDNPIAAGHSPGRRENGDYPYLDPAMLKDQSFILSRQHMRLRQSSDEFFRVQGIEPDVAVTVASIPSAHRLAAYGVGVAFLPERFVRELAQPPYPVYFKTDETLRSWTVGIACDDRRDNRLVKQVIRIFEDICGLRDSFSKI